MSPTPPQAPQHVGFQPQPVGAPPAPQPYHIPQFQPSPVSAPPQPAPQAPPKGPHWDAWFGTVNTQIQALVDHAPPHQAPAVNATIHQIIAKHGGGQGLSNLNEAQFSAIFNDLQAAYPPAPSQPARSF